MYTPRPHQSVAIRRLRNGSVLVGRPGAGKSFTALGYFYERVLGGSIEPPSLPVKSTPLYVLTTAKKRDSLDWDAEASNFGISVDPVVSVTGASFVVDSWHNIKHYVGVQNAFFIFDEQGVTGKGAWVRSFLKITKKNEWILLSATPADQWTDLIPIFVANGYYRNRTDFIRQHVLYAPYVKYPKITGYLNEDKLKRLRDSVYVVMASSQSTISHVVHVDVEYDKAAVTSLIKTRWNPVKDRPVKNRSEFIHAMRRLINTDPSRITASVDVWKKAEKLIIFYNFDYELKLLRKGFKNITTVAEYNGHVHDPVPSSEEWVYLVQYQSGSEAWECFSTNQMLFYSLSYSYRKTIQAMGRVDRLTTTYSDLYYYKLVSSSTLDKRILEAFNNKRDFNVASLGDL